MSRLAEKLHDNLDDVKLTKKGFSNDVGVKQDESKQLGLVKINEKGTFVFKLTILITSIETQNSTFCNLLPFFPASLFLTSCWN